MPQKNTTKPEGCGGAQGICLLEWDTDYYGMVLTYRGFPGGLPSKKSTCNVGDLGSIPGLGRSPGEGNSNSFQYSCLENSIDRGARGATVHGATKSWTRLSDLPMCVCVRTFCCTVYVHIHVHTLMSVNYMPDRNAMEPCSCHFPIGALT